MSPTPKAINSFVELRRRAQELDPKRVAVVAADDDVALTAASGALSLGMATPVLIGDARTIHAKAQSLELADLITKADIITSENPVATAVRMAGDGKLGILLKGHLRTDELLHAVLDKRLFCVLLRPTDIVAA